jgi:Hint domain
MGKHDSPLSMLTFPDDAAISTRLIGQSGDAAGILQFRGSVCSVSILQQLPESWPETLGEPQIRAFSCIVRRASQLIPRREGGKMAPRCFLRGTQIWTPHGERRVEDLRIGDLVVTFSGEAMPIQWVWGQRFEREAGHRWTEEIAPVRVAQSALGPNTPHRDLYLSRYHCLYLDGVLIPAVDLVNGSTIARFSAEDRREIEYFHFKLDRHSVIYAEGAACETLQAVTAVNSDSFEFEEYRRLHGEPSLPDEPVAPVLGYNGGRARLRGRIRSAVSLVVDVRSKLEIVRDGLNERAQSFAHDSR